MNKTTTQPTKVTEIGVHRTVFQLGYAAGDIWAVRDESRVLLELTSSDLERLYSALHASTSTLTADGPAQWAATMLADLAQVMESEAAARA